MELKPAVEENFGGIFQSLVDNTIVMHIANMGRAKLLMPLNYPREDIRVSYGLVSYRRLADSLEEHIKNAAKVIGTDPLQHYERWDKYVGTIIEQVEDDLDSYEPEWQDSKKKFYQFVFNRALISIKQKTENVDTEFMQFVLAHCVKATNTAMYDNLLFENRNKLNDFQSFLRFEFQTKVAIYVTSRLERNKLWEDLN